MGIIGHMDDDKNTRETLGANLIERGYVYVGTDSVLGLLSLIRTKGSDIDLILIDQKMSPQKGSDIVPTILNTYAALQRSDKEKYAKRPPIVLCSGEDEAGLALIAKQCGADGHLNKGLLSGSQQLFDMFYQRIDSYAKHGLTKKPA